MAYFDDFLANRELSFCTEREKDEEERTGKVSVERIGKSKIMETVVSMCNSLLEKNSRKTKLLFFANSQYQF